MFLMRKMRRYAATLAACAMCATTTSARVPFREPDIKVILGDTSKDWQIYDSKTGNYVGLDSHASLSRDESTGEFVFEYRGPEGSEAYTTRWTPRSQLSLTVATDVSQQENNDIYRYSYEIFNAKESRQAMSRLIYCNTPKAESFELPSDEWRFLSIWRERGDYQCLRPASDSGIAGLKAGDNLRGFTVSSPFLPTVLDAKAIGEGAPGVRGNSPYHDLPESVERALIAYTGSFDDCVNGQVVGPGGLTVRVPELEKFLEASIRNGWLAENAPRERIRELIELILRAHGEGHTGAVLDTLYELQELVKKVYESKSSPILSEAYALFYFNIEYLLKNYKKDVMGDAVGNREMRK